MNIEKWWPTHIGINNYADLEPNFCLRLLKEVFDTVAKDGWENQSLWYLESMGPLLTKLQVAMTADANEYAKASGFSHHFELGGGWINQNKPGSIGSSTPHSHAGSHFVSVFYPQALPNCGDLLLQDHRGGMVTEPMADIIDGRRVTSRVYKRFTPKTGDVIFFPGYTIHSVEPNKSTDLRISFASNLRMVDSNNAKLNKKLYGYD